MPHLFSFRNKTVLLFIIILLTSSINAAEEYKVVSGDTLSKILLNKGYANTHAELTPYIEDIKTTHSTYFSKHSVNHILPGMTLQLPKHPNTIVVSVATPVKEEPIVKTIGSITITRGTTYIIREGNRLTTKKITGLHAGDIINTASNTNATIVLVDNSRYELGSNTEFRIDTYNYSASDAPDIKNEVNTSIVTLIKGAARALTGKIGKLTGEKYKFNTRTVTIGIRGTEFTTRFCEGTQCGNFSGASVAVTNGEVDATNKTGTVSIREKEFINVNSQDQGIEITAIPEGFLDLNKNIIDLKETWWQKLISIVKTLI